MCSLTAALSCAMRASVPWQPSGLGTIPPVAPSLNHGLEAPRDTGLPPRENLLFYTESEIQETGPSG